MDFLKEILPCLPEKVANAVCKLDSTHITEIRLRANGLQTVLYDGRELVISKDLSVFSICKEPLVLEGKDIEKVVFSLCSGSVYAYSEQIKQGFITKNGVRVGIGGAAIMKDGALSGFSSYTSLNIRFPRHIENCAEQLFSLLSKKGSHSVGGILVISPPGGGKTTFLRSFTSGISRSFSDGGKVCRKRVCVIDERAEIYMKDAFSNSCADFLTYLPKEYSIELATRVLSPEYIVCDEIGNEQEAEAICKSSTKGVTFVASCHGKNLFDVMQKPMMQKLFGDKVFSTACELSCVDGKYTCSVKTFPKDTVC
ncbi:MAG: hypothetical protein E7656_01000 [Ruminococcaceae bacterium]|nr:hypothetical protein [Oscillospiraceae bacterium]